jgi:hypothetical protein
VLTLLRRVLGQGLPEYSTVRQLRLFHLSYEDNSATRTESVLFDREEQEEDLVFPVDEAGEREFFVAKVCWEGKNSMQVSACTQP